MGKENKSRKDGGNKSSAELIAKEIKSKTDEGKKLSAEPMKERMKTEKMGKEFRVNKIRTEQMGGKNKARTDEGKKNKARTNEAKKIRPEQLRERK